MLDKLNSNFLNDFIRNHLKMIKRKLWIIYCNRSTNSVKFFNFTFNFRHITHKMLNIIKNIALVGFVNVNCHCLMLNH